MTTFKEVCAPLDLEDLKLKFTTPGLVYVIDVRNSTLKGKVLLTYLSNLELDYRLKLEQPDDAFGLIKAYMEAEVVYKSVDLELLVLNTLLHAVGVETELTFDPSTFIEENKELFRRWLKITASLHVYTEYTKGCEAEELGCEIIAERSVSGCNFANLLNYENYHYLIGLLSDVDGAFYQRLFSEYVFKGENLFRYWAVENNPYYLFSVLETSGETDKSKIADLIQSEISTLEKELQERT